MGLIFQEKKEMKGVLHHARALRCVSAAAVQIADARRVLWYGRREGGSICV